MSLMKGYREQEIINSRALSHYTAFTIARGFKVKSLYISLHTVIRPQLRGATKS